MGIHLYFAGGLRAILTDQNKLVVAVGGVTALAAGIYTTRYSGSRIKLNICIFCCFEYSKEVNDVMLHFL